LILDVKSFSLFFGIYAEAAVPFNKISPEEDTLSKCTDSIYYTMLPESSPLEGVVFIQALESTSSMGWSTENLGIL
jgi:hypothetical protein